MESAPKGTVTSLASEYPPEEARAAAMRVNDSIAAAQLEMERLRGFISDNGNLINLVQKLPDSLHHHVMVPFGKAAFFPGRLVHTNEFLVLLGDGYYADATAKQTLDILKRRAKSLESQLSSVNAVVQDLRAEASFFQATASEIAESGIVEIREEYVEESSIEGNDSEQGPIERDSFESDGKKVARDEEEFARIMARLDELEKEELEEEAENHSDDEQVEADFKVLSDRVSLHGVQSAQKPETLAEEVRNKLACTGLTAQALQKDGPTSHGDSSSSSTKEYVVDSAVPTVVDNKFQAFTSSQSQDHVPSSERSFDSRKAFSGSIIEHAENLDTNSRKHTPSQVSGSQPSKPVSRFKMMRQ